MYLALASALILGIVNLASAHGPVHFQTNLKNGHTEAEGLGSKVPFKTRAYWMRRANSALFEVLRDPCPFAAFGTVIVNHTATGLGKEVCIGVNSSGQSGNPTQHGEMAAINNCTAILTDPHGPYKLTASEALRAFSELSLYTNGESCPMCASAIRWSGFREYIYGTTIETLIEKGWGQIRISSREVVRQSADLGPTPKIIGELLTNETDPYFLWQFDSNHECPHGCSRSDGRCIADSRV